MTKIDLSALRPVEISDRARFDKVLAIMGSQSCEACFPNIFMYRQPYGIEVIEIEGRMVVYERQTRVIHYPLGEPVSPELLYAISKAFVDAGLTDGGIYDVPEDFLDNYPDCDSLFDLEYDEGAIDYLFSVEKIATFNGSKLRKKHNLVKQFQANWPYAAVQKITPENIAVAAKLARDLNSRLEWCEFLEEESLALESAWANFEALGLQGIILFAEPDYPAGLSVFSALPSDTVDVHFEKADHAVKGASQTLTWQLAIALRGKAKFMNREQDMNEENLRHAKRSLDPERFFKRYFLRNL